MNLCDYTDNDFKMEVVDKTTPSIFSDFTCGNETIDKHFQKSDFQDTVCYAYVDRKANATVGLADICCSAINCIYDDTIVIMHPAIKIEHFAVSLDYQDALWDKLAEEDDHFYLSDMFLCSLINYARVISEKFIGASYMILHSVPDAKHFYERNGFQTFSEFMKLEKNYYVNDCIPMLLQL